MFGLIGEEQAGGKAVEPEAAFDDEGAPGVERQFEAEGIRHRAAMALHVTDLATAEPELRQQHEQQQGQEYRRERRHRSMISSRTKPSDYIGRPCMAQAPNGGQRSE